MQILLALFIIYVGLGWTWYKYRFLWNKNEEPEIVSQDAAITSYALGGSHQDAAISAIVAGFMGWICAPALLLFGIVYFFIAVAEVLGLL